MKLNHYTDYALRLLIYLAVHPDRSPSIQEVADAYGVSAHHLAKIVQALGRAGWVQSIRGRGGGLRLKTEPENIGVGDVVREMETSLELVECFGDHSQCPIEPVCGLREVLTEAQDSFFDALDQYTLADLVPEPQAYVPLLVQGR